LLTPVQIGRLTLSHRIVMPVLSGLRAQPGSGIPNDLMLEYYSQRAFGGGPIVTEARGDEGRPCLSGVDMRRGADVLGRF
jgi:2,4-dienoyl-CoA reductase-like NADH-dependent reductase (Old Yellow Enzyme family)